MNQTKYTMTKKAFEHLLCGLVDVKDLSVCPFKEETFQDDGYLTFTTVNLYYLKGRHIGSWHQGKAWIFNDVLETTKEQA